MLPSSMKLNLPRSFAAFALCCSPLPMPAQPPAAAPIAYQFAPADLMSIGVYYYPEAWPAAQARDMANIKNSAWSCAPGRIRRSWSRRGFV